MRYGEGDRESENVEDRRGEGGGRFGGGGIPIPLGGGGLSVGSLVVIGIICLMLGINPLELLSSGDGVPRLPDVQRPSQGPRSPFEVPGGQQVRISPEEAEMTRFVRRVLADTEALTGILTYHVVPEQLSGADLVAGGTFATVNGAELTVADVNGTLVVNGGAAAVLCGDVPTANATVFLIDSVLMPPA